MGMNGVSLVGVCPAARMTSPPWMSSIPQSLVNPDSPLKPDHFELLEQESTAMAYRQTDGSPARMSAAWQSVRIAPAGEDQLTLNREAIAPLFRQPSAPLTEAETTEKLKSIGLSDKNARELLNRLAKNGDGPYHAGRLWNGKAYLLTRNDAVYYGWPNHLQKTATMEYGRTRCPDRQVRWMRTDNGLSFRVNRNTDRQTAVAAFAIPILGNIPIPQWKQTGFFAG